MFWVLISTHLLNALQELGFGTDFQGALSSSCAAFVAFAFIDDTDLIETVKYSHDRFEDVGNQMQWALDLWSGMIKATDGALVPKKMF